MFALVSAKIKGLGFSPRMGQDGTARERRQEHSVGAMKIDDGGNTCLCHSCDVLMA